MNGDGACCFLVGVGCWNCSRARLTQFFMLVLSVLLSWFQSKSTPACLEPVQSVLMGQCFLREATKCSASSCLSWQTPKSLTTKLKEMGLVLWKNDPGACLEGWQPCFARFSLSCLFASLPDCLRPQTAHLISMWTQPSVATLSLS